MEKKTVGTIRENFRKIEAFFPVDLMEQEKAYRGFVLTYGKDPRSGVQALVSRGNEKLKALDAERRRLETMQKWERKYREKYPLIAGVDEVGRGPLAGPVVTAAVILPQDLLLLHLNDSKQVRPEMRERLSTAIQERAVACAIGSNTEKTIDCMGISAADLDAMRQAVEGLSVKPDLVLTDAFRIPGLSIPQIPIVKGDTLSVSIAAASIVAKVVRDHFMEKMDIRYPGYGFASNKGYGSAAHLKALREKGPCEIHRKSFLRGILPAEGEAE